MNDSLSLTMRVTAHDDASPVLKKIAGEIDRLNDKLRKTVGDAKRAASASVAGSPNQTKTKPRSTSEFVRETADAARALKLKFTGLTKVAALQRREAGSIAKAQATADRAATAALKAKIQGTAKVTALRVGAEKAVANEAAKVEKQGITALRTKLATMARVSRQRLASEQAVAREQARTAADGEQEHAASLKRQIAGHRYLHGLRTRMDRQAARERQDDRDDLVRHTRKAGSHAGDAASRFSRTGTMAAAAMVGGTVAAARKGITVRGDADAAETELRTFGSEPASGKSSGSTMTQADVVKIRKGWLDRTAIDNGMSAAEAIRAYTEVRKAGIDENKARAVTEQLMASRAGMDMDLSEITSISGKVLTNRPNLDLKRWQNSFAIAAGTTAASPNQMVQGAKRAQGVLAATNMSPEDMNAYLATFIGAGVEPGKAGNFLAEQAITLQNAGNERGQRLKDLNQAARLTGFGSAKGLSASMTRDAAGTMELFYSNVAKLDERTRALVARRLGGKEWDDETLQATNAVATLKKTRQAIHDPRNANYLDKAKSEKMNSWGGMWSRSVAVAKLGWEKFGAGFDELLRATNEFVDRIGKSVDFDKITQMVRSALEGVKDGLGIKSWSEGLNALFGDMKSENFAGMLEQIRSFFRGFVQGVRIFADTIRSFASAILGGDVSAGRLGKLTGAVLAFAVGLFIVAPVVGILASITSALVALGFGAAAAWGILKGLGIVGGGAKPPSPVRPVGPATAASGGLMSRIMGGLGKLFVPAAVATTTSMSSEDKDKLALRLGKYATAHSPVATDPAKPAEKSLTDRILGLFGRSSAPEADTKPVTPPSPVRAWADVPPKIQDADKQTKAISQAVVPKIPAKPVVPDGIPLAPNSIALAVGDFHDRLKAILDAFLDRLEKLLTGMAVNGSAIRTTTAMGDVAETVRAVGARIQLAALGSGGSAVSGLGSSLSNIGGGGNSGLGSSLSNIGGGGNSGSGGGSLAYVSGGGTRAGQRVSDYAGGAYSPAPNSMAGRTFATKAPGIMANLQKDFGLTKEQAAGILGNLGHESAGMTAYQEGKPLGGGRGGAGWAQWTGPRRRAFEAWSARNGLDPRSDAANYGFLKHELTGSHAGALASLKRQTTVDGATIDFERTYEAAGIKHYGSRLGYARKAFAGGTEGAVPNPDANTGTGNVLADMQRMRQTGRVLNEQCVSLAKAAVGATGSVTTWQKGVGAEAGTLKAGTPVATFLDRMGRQSDRYAGGGIGTMGAKLDHAGVFEKYITDAAGKRIGMQIAEQYRGSGGVRSKAYLFGRGFGEGNGSNYHAVLGPDGQPLGGDRNPMSLARQAAAPTPESLAKAAEGGQFSRIGDALMLRNGGAVGGNGAAITAPITINHHGDSAQLANQVQNRIQETRNWQSRDQDFQSV